MLIGYLILLFKTLAYIGPGLGGGVIAAVLGVLASFFLALFAILWYPFKRLYQKIRKKSDDI
ncbi:MAG: hypothetical protein HXX14_17145 [Bacteroidetes bacterium]|nr:hypothetical protein [Bacteroidota bacterium]